MNVRGMREINLWYNLAPFAAGRDLIASQPNLMVSGNLRRTSSRRSVRPDATDSRSREAMDGGDHGTVPQERP